ncbi:MAG: M23 family metallopeptidase [Acidobacteria bacterium]|nr:M23 family metallopeptidase [Acidobacteriota bacterium]MCA1651424.1 M23 family metallopeptidase [Acidobacteriota bacterium]
MSSSIWSNRISTGEVAATGFDNYLLLQHADGTTALYGHVMHQGVLVEVGETVAQGQIVARSGNTGNTGNKPHLHFSVAACDPVSRGTAACPTLPVNFGNRAEPGWTEGRPILSRSPVRSRYVRRCGNSVVSGSSQVRLKPDTTPQHRSPWP